MKPGGGRLKGAAFEREIASILHGLTGVGFKRDLEQYRSSSRGDLVADDPDFPFVIECKRYASGTTARPGWWEQACNAARAQSKWPALIYRFDRCETIVRVPINIFLTKDDNWRTWVEMPLPTFAMVASDLMGEVPNGFNVR